MEDCTLNFIKKRCYSQVTPFLFYSTLFPNLFASRQGTSIRLLESDFNIIHLKFGACNLILKRWHQMKFQVFFLKKSKRRFITYLILTILFCFFVTSIPVNAGLFGEKIKKISDNEFKKVIKVELSLSKDPNFYSYDDSILKEALDKEINSQETVDYKGFEKLYKVFEIIFYKV